MIFDPYKEAKNININDRDENGDSIAQKQKEQEKQENRLKDDNDKLDSKVAGKLAFVKVLLQSKAFDKARELLEEVEQAECNRVGSEGYCDNPEVYWCKVLLKYEARGEEDLISKQPDLDNDEDFLLAVNCCKNEEQKQPYLAVLNKTNAAKKQQAQIQQAASQAVEQPREEKSKPAKISGDFDDAFKKKLRRISHMIDAGDFDEARERLDKIEQDEEDSTGDCEIPLVYHYKMLLDYKARDDEELIAHLAERQEDITKNRNYRLAKSCAEDAEDDDEFNTLLDIKKKATEGIAKAKAEADRKRKEEEERKKREEEEQKRKAEEARKALNALWDYKDLGNGYVNFGAYPRSKKADNVNIGEIYDDGRGYYLGSDNCLYEKYEGCYYKLEPIKWKVLSRGSEYLVVSDMILDAQCFDDSNDYEDSEIRSWLNNDFYKKAFKDSQQSKIVTTNVDNSLSSTGYSSNQYTCGNTSDKVFLLSHKEVQQYFSSNSSRQKKGTDYAKARDLYVGNGYSYWWLRSPYYRNGHYAQYVYIDGRFGWDYVYRGSVGVLPALKIKP